MALREKLDLLKRQCDYQSMLLRNISQIVDIAPSELVEQQLFEVEKTMRVVTDPPPAREAGQTTILGYFSNNVEGHVYALRLQGDEHAENYYYVGFTQDLPKRLHQHFNGEGAIWTKLHPPLNVMRILEGGKSDERAVTIEMMKQYGYTVVRGYCWCSQVLKAPPRELS
jgi:predicted GIY-YIG superfamily endonuclease